MTWPWSPSIDRTPGRRHPEPLFNRKQRLSRILSGSPDAIVYNEHITHDGPTVFDHVCRLGLEGIVSKRLDAPYRSGPSKAWLKSKNPLSEAVRREHEEDWSWSTEILNTR
jgi:ATP-dependent DNA ligase